VPPLSIWIFAFEPATAHVAVVPMLCVFWMTKTSFAVVKFAGDAPPPPRTVFQLANVFGGTLPCEK
jgi:hypothetical protein